VTRETEVLIFHEPAFVRDLGYDFYEHDHQQLLFSESDFDENLDVYRRLCMVLGYDLNVLLLLNNVTTKRSEQTEVLTSTSTKDTRSFMSC
jgi:hypothetical protein